MDYQLHANYVSYKLELIPIVGLDILVLILEDRKDESNLMK